MSSIFETFQYFQVIQFLQYPQSQKKSLKIHKFILYRQKHVFYRVWYKQCLRLLYRTKQENLYYLDALAVMAGNCWECISFFTRLNLCTAHAIHTEYTKLPKINQIYFPSIGFNHRFKRFLNYIVRNSVFLKLYYTGMPLIHVC